MDTPPPDTWADPAATDSVGRRYEWLGLLGRGGFGEVYLAHMSSVNGLQRHVAVKMLPEGHGANSPSVVQLRKEAQMLATLEHPVVVAPVDLAQFGTRVALVTEFVAGEDLASCIDPADPGRLPVSTQLEVIEQVASALEAAWTQRSVVHRDVKPQNIRIGRHGNVKLLDFGLASSDVLDRTVHTVDRGAGTMRYLAPERFVPKRPLTPASDVYSLGCVLYEGVTGTPFVGSRPLPKGYGVSVQPEEWAAYVDAQLAVVHDAGIRPLLHGMLAHAAEQRPTANEVRERCDQLAVLDSGRIRLSKWCRDRKWSDTGGNTPNGPGNTIVPIAPNVPHPPVTPKRRAHLDEDRLATADPSPAEEAHLATCVSCRSTRRLLLDGLRIGPYKLLGRIGRGGMGVVYAAEHAETGERRALKVLRLATAGLERRIRREAELQTRVANPHLLPLLEVLEHRDAPVLVLPLVEGPTLAALLAEHPPPREVAAAWFAHIVDGVAALHGAGLIHRDLKPANVLLDPSSGVVVPKIADFGLAKWLLDEDPSVLTKSGMRIGTMAYTAPEQLFSAKDAGPTADVWSLGILALELLTGTLDRDLLPSLPEPWAGIVGRLLQQSPEDRPADATEVVALLPTTGPVEGLWVELCRSMAPKIQPDGVPSKVAQTSVPEASPLPGESSVELGPRGARWAWLGLIATAAVAVVGGAMSGTFDREPAMLVRPAQGHADVGFWEGPRDNPVAVPRRIEEPWITVAVAPPPPPPQLIELWIRTKPWGYVTVAGQQHKTNQKILVPLGSNVLTLHSHDGTHRTDQTIDIAATGTNTFCWSFDEERVCSP